MSKFFEHVTEGLIEHLIRNGWMGSDGAEVLESEAEVIREYPHSLVMLHQW